MHCRKYIQRIHTVCMLITHIHPNTTIMIRKKRWVGWYIWYRKKLLCKGKCKDPLERIGGVLAHLPFLGHWACRWVYHWVCDAWPVRRQTYGYLPRLRASSSFGGYQIILLGEQRHMYCVWTTCPESLRVVERPGLEPATYWLQVRCPVGGVAQW